MGGARTNLLLGVATALAMLALLPPAAFILLTLIEGQILVPMVIGARFTLHPLLVVLATLIGAWAWGIGGTLVAVPVLMAVKIVSDHIDGMKPLARVLSHAGATAAPIGLGTTSMGGR